jgi:hypothetical protein
MKPLVRNGFVLEPNKGLNLNSFLKTFAIFQQGRPVEQKLECLFRVLTGKGQTSKDPGVIDLKQLERVVHTLIDGGRSGGDPEVSLERVHLSFKAVAGDDEAITLEKFIAYLKGAIPNIEKALTIDAAAGR